MLERKENQSSKRQLFHLTIDSLLFNDVIAVRLSSMPQAAERKFPLLLAKSVKIEFKYESFTCFGFD